MQALLQPRSPRGVGEYCLSLLPVLSHGPHGGRPNRDGRQPPPWSLELYAGPGGEGCPNRNIGHRCRREAVATFRKKSQYVQKESQTEKVREREIEVKKERKKRGYVYTYMYIHSRHAVVLVFIYT